MSHTMSGRSARPNSARWPERVSSAKELSEILMFQEQGFAGPRLRFPPRSFLIEYQCGTPVVVIRYTSRVCCAPSAVISSNFRQAMAVLHTRVVIKEPVGVMDRQIFFSFAGLSALIVGLFEVWALAPAGMRIIAIAARNFIVRLLPSA